MKLVLALIALAASRQRQAPEQSALKSYAAASLANKVVDNAKNLAEGARKSLEHAHEAIKKVRTGTEGLNAEAHSQLAKADESLELATAKADFEALEEAEWAAGVADQTGSDRATVDALRAEIDQMESTASEYATPAQQEEFNKLKASVSASLDGQTSTAHESLGGLQDDLDQASHQLETSADIDALNARLDGEAPAHSSAREDLERQLQEAQDKLDDLTPEEGEDPPSPEEIAEVEDEIRRIQEDIAQHVMEEENDLPESADASSASADEATSASADEATSASASGGELDVNGNLPFEQLEPFGREDTAQELTDSSVMESDGMVDQIEKAETAEEKRAVFRALTRLRGAAIASFDGIAHAHTANIDEYAHTHKWRDDHPLHHLASEENDVKSWAFPTNADIQMKAEPATGRAALGALLQR